MPRPTLIVLSGMPATGKSTLAAAIARRIGAPVFSVDPIESAMLEARMPRSPATGLAAYLVARTLAESQLSFRHDAIVDAVNSVEYAKLLWTQLAVRQRVRLLVIECICSNETLHRRRLALRRRRLARGFREPTWREVVKRRREWVPWTLPTLTIDAARSMATNMRHVVRWLG